MTRLALAAAAGLAIIVAPTEIMPVIVVGLFVLQMVEGIMQAFKGWREATTVRFSIVSAVLALVSLAMLKLR
ncbi:MAG TPA: hypothetical protein VH913_01380 [Hyphomicrobiaceae bacterium]|jgi:hypothetical protein